MKRFRVNKATLKLITLGFLSAAFVACSQGDNNGQQVLPPTGYIPGTCIPGQVCTNQFLQNGIAGAGVFTGYFTNVNPTVVREIVNPIINFTAFYGGFYPPPVQYSGPASLTISQNPMNPTNASINMLLGGSLGINTAGALLLPTNNSTANAVQFVYGNRYSFRIELDQLLSNVGIGGLTNATVTLLNSQKSPGVTGNVGVVPLIRVQ